MNRLAFSLCLPLIVACQPGALDDPGFDLWCGKSLCRWKTEQGTIRRVPTWNEEDYGVELVGKPVVLSQLANTEQIGDDPCLQLSILGNVETKAEVQLELDFFDDGTVEYREGIPGIRWQRLDLLVRLPTQPYDNLKVALHKQAGGTAVFGSLAASGSSKCEGDPIVLSDLPFGYKCNQDTSCASGICDVGAQTFAVKTCDECRTNDDCTGGFVCGAVRPEQSPWPSHACVPPQTAQEGDICWSDEQCAHGHCQNGACGECASDAECGGDRVCGSLPTPGSRHRACVVPGSLPNDAGCMAAEDCASGSCCGHICLDATRICPYGELPTWTSPDR